MLPKSQDGHIFHQKVFKATIKFCTDGLQNNSVLGRAHYFLTHFDRDLQEDTFEMKKGRFGMVFKRVSSIKSGFRPECVFCWKQSALLASK